MKTFTFCLTLLCVFGGISSFVDDARAETYNIYLAKINEKYGLNLKLIEIVYGGGGYDSEDYRFDEIRSMIMNEYGNKDECAMHIIEKHKMNYVQVAIECVYYGFKYSFESLNFIADHKQLEDLTNKVEFYLAKINEQNQGVQLKFNRSHLATVQTDYGLSYEMFADIHENGQLVGCRMKLWEQNLENYQRMDVECGTEKRKYTYERAIWDGYHDLDEKELQMLKPQLSAIFSILGDKHKDFGFTLMRIVNGKRQAVDDIEYKKHFIVTAEANDRANEFKQCHCEFYQDRYGNYQPCEVDCGGKTFRYTPI